MSSFLSLKCVCVCCACKLSPNVWGSSALVLFLRSWHVPHPISHPNMQGFVDSFFFSPPPKFSASVSRSLTRGGAGFGRPVAVVEWALACVHRTNISDRAGHKRTPFTQSCTTFAITRGSALSIAKCSSSLVYIIPSCASRVHQSLPGPGRFYKMCLVSPRSLHRIFFSLLWFLVTCTATATASHASELPVRRDGSPEGPSHISLGGAATRSRATVANTPFIWRHSLGSQGVSLCLCYIPPLFSGTSSLSNRMRTCRLRYSACRGSPSLLVTHRKLKPPPPTRWQRGGGHWYILASARALSRNTPFSPPSQPAPPAPNFSQFPQSASGCVEPWGVGVEGVGGGARNTQGPTSLSIYT